MPTENIRHVRIYPKQKQFLEGTALFRAFAAGIAAGKSWVGAYDMVRRAKPGRLYMVSAPTYPLLADASFRSVEKVVRDLDLMAGLARGSTPYIKLKTGAEILFRSAHDPEMLRGPNLSGVWLDEASLCKQSAFDILIGRLREGGELGWLTSTFTPKGKSHWTYKKFGTGQPDTMLVHARTDENPFLADQFAETRRKQYSAQQSEQELGGVFLDGAGNHFTPGSWPRYIDIEDGSLSIPGAPRKVYIRSQYTVMVCLDWAMGKRKKKALTAEFLDDDGRKGDFTAFVVIALTFDGLMFILEVVNERIKLEENAPRLAELCKRWKPAIVAADDDMLSETMTLECRRYPAIPEIKRLPIGGKDKLTRAQAAIIHGENGRILLPTDTKRFTYPWLESFVDQLSGFTGIDDDHDDMVDGLGIGGRMADILKGDGREHPLPDLLTPARDLFGGNYSDDRNYGSTFG